MQSARLPGVKRPKVHKGVQELIMAAAQLRLGHGDATVKLRVALQAVLDDGLDGEEDGYYSSEDEDEIDPETAAKGLGSGGRVHVHAPLRRRLVPQDLLRACEKHAKARGANLKSHRTKLPLMMRALRVDARGGVKRTHLRPTPRAFLHPKNRQKCRMILDASPINGADPRRPQKFTLLEQLRDWMRGGGGDAWMANLDLQNAFWSVGLAQGFGSVNRRQAVIPLHAPALWMALLPHHLPVPRPWHRDCRPARRAGPVVGVYRRHSCHRSQFIRGAARSATQYRRVQRAGFIISHKSETTPTMEPSFIGKHINRDAGYFQNAPGGLRSALRVWVRAMGRATIEARRLRKLLGQLCWPSRPNAGLSCFMAGSYQALDSGARWFTRSMARGLGTVLLFSAVAQPYPPDAHEGGMQQVPGKGDLLLFADAAPDGERFRVGLVGDRRFRRSIRCPAWVTSLQQAELFGIYYACKVTSYRGHRSVLVGTYSDANRFQVAGHRATACSQAHQRILRRLFWLRLWSHVKLGVFRVDAAENPADPLSRVRTFPSRRHAVQDANDRRQLWERSAHKFLHLHYLPQAPWSLAQGEGGEQRPAQEQRESGARIREHFVQLVHGGNLICACSGGQGCRG